MMTPLQPPQRIRPQRGFGLLETLVGMSMGLLAVATVAQLLQAAQVSQAQLLAQMELDADGRQQLAAMAQQLLQAGSASLTPNTDGSVTLHWPDGRALSTATDASGEPELEIRYAIDTQSAHAGCLWLSREAMGDTSINRYTRGADASLRCRANGYTQPLINQVRQWRLDFAVPRNGGIQWTSDSAAQARAVRVCLHLEGRASPDVPPTVRGCDGRDLPTNGRQQSIQSRTIWLAIAPT